MTGPSFADEPPALHRDDPLLWTVHRYNAQAGAFVMRVTGGGGGGGACAAVPDVTRRAPAHAPSPDATDHE